jgi:hypothetical protein
MPVLLADPLTARRMAGSSAALAARTGSDGGFFGLPRTHNKARKRRVMDRRHFIGGLFWLAFSIFVAVHALELGLGTIIKPGPGAIFFWSSVGLGALSVALIMKSAFRKGETTPLRDMWKGLKWRYAVLVIGLLVFYGLVLDKVGFVLSTFLLMSGLFAIGKIRFWVAIISGMATTIASLVLFRYLLEVQLPGGILGL